MAQAPTLADLPTLAPMVAAGAPVLAVASAAVLRRGPLQATPLEAFLGLLAGGRRGKEEWSEVGVGTALSSWFLSLQVPLLLLVAAADVPVAARRSPSPAARGARAAAAVARSADGEECGGQRQQQVVQVRHRVEHNCLVPLDSRLPCRRLPDRRSDCGDGRELGQRSQPRQQLHRRQQQPAADLSQGAHGHVAEGEDAANAQ
mmetsp:Transcript_1488/g.4875  ORF Transcript_1488/g.4875 Transcript_1488/m.4875 type:complete len:203 (-) Transcript_1488:274-882(-)